MTTLQLFEMDEVIYTVFINYRAALRISEIIIIVHSAAL